jgi:hypothetical protein
VTDPEVGDAAGRVFTAPCCLGFAGVLSRPPRPQARDLAVDRRLPNRAPDSYARMPRRGHPKFGSLPAMPTAPLRLQPWLEHYNTRPRRSALGGFHQPAA